VSVVADRDDEDPSGVDVGEAHRPSELAFECGPAVSDGVNREEPLFVFGLVPGPTHPSHSAT
jgi:hypothetical protein